MTAAGCTLHELLAVHIARDIRDGEVGFTGLATGGAAALFATAIPLAAMALARRTHAPSMTILLAGWSHNPSLERLDALPDSEFDTGLRDLECEAQMIDYPGTFALRRGDVDFGFSSGVQVDVQGNLNTVCVGDYRRPKVRLVGPILVPEHMTQFGRAYVMMPHHEVRNFVEKVDYVAGVGYPGGLAGRRRLGLDRGGPELVVTPKCLFDFDKERGRMRLRSIHPGVTPDQLRAATGFDLGEMKAAVETPAPTREELQILRHEVDPRGVLLPRPDR
jgi:glutaconate CoA-transferase subunit B